ncbi:MAG: metal-dependent hydrolase [Nanoarchaeota archaeon]
MLWRTHLAIALAVALYFSNHVDKPLIFIPVVLISSFFPDIDSRFSHIGKKAIFRPVQWTASHRGIIHSYTLCILLSFLIALVYPVLALPFFLGYVSHLFADSFTSQGIRPFWPLKAVSRGAVTTGGKTDMVIFYTFVIIDLVLLGTILYSW